jgi:hypothetical protein
MVLGDHGLQYVVSSGLEGYERALLIGAHESAVANYVGGENGGKPALDTFFGHELPLRLKTR